MGRRVLPLRYRVALALGPGAIRKKAVLLSEHGLSFLKRGLLSGAADKDRVDLGSGGVFIIASHSSDFACQTL